MNRLYKNLLKAHLIAAISIFSFQTSKATIFNNTGVITVVDGAPASPYSSVINVSGMAGTVSNITVTLKNVSHDYIMDMSVILQAPSGQSLLLQSGAGEPNTVSNITYTFSDAGASQLPATGNIVSTTYKPTGYYWDIWPSPAPPTPPGVGTYRIPGPFNSGLPISTLASTFNGLSPNGAWKLWVADFSAGGDPGVISGGWSLNISTSIVTPVALKEFKATDLGCKVGLSWKTEQESNMASYEVERKMNESDFIRIGSVNAKDRSVSENDYLFTDNSIKDAHYEYRLKMVDLDGHSAYSDIQTIEMACASQLIDLFPNPSNGSTTLQIKTGANETITIKVTDLSGRVIYRSSTETQIDMKRIVLPSENWNKGIYFVSVESESMKQRICFSKN